MSVGGCALVLVLATSASSAAAQRTGERPLTELANAYREGDRELAVAAVSLQPLASLEAETGLLAASLAKSRAAAEDPLRRAAAALLTESAIFSLEAGEVRRVARQLGFAGQLVHAGPVTRGDRFDLHFHLVAGIALHCAGELSPANETLAQGLGETHGDAELLTASGAVVETIAALRQYEPSPDSDRRRSRLGGYATESGGSGSLEGVSLARAEAFYDHALGLDPGLAEARLRRGRVRVLRGSNDRALTDLERTAAEGTLGQRYLARLFEGRARESHDDLQGAAQAYRAATGLVPAQSALLALGRVLDRLGERREAQDAFEAASAAEAPKDPWWDYQSGQPQRLDDLLLELRALVRPRGSAK